MTQIKISDPTLEIPTDYDNVRMELFEKIGDNYVIRYDDARTFMNIAADLAKGLVEFPITNNTGAVLTRGSITYPKEGVGSTLADPYYKDRCSVIGMVKDDIPVGGKGTLVKLGLVTGLNTLGFVAGQVAFLGVNGTFTPNLPSGGGFICIVGVVTVVSATSGAIVIDTSVSSTTIELTDHCGIPTDQRDVTTLAFADGTRTFTITPTAGKFHYYVEGAKFEHTTPQSVAIDNTTGIHVIYFDGLTLTSILKTTVEDADNIILTKAVVGVVYWNAQLLKSIVVGDARYGLMPPIVHSYLNKRFGAFYRTGLALENIVIGNGSLASHAQYGTASGKITSEDIDVESIQVPSTLGLTILYRSGNAGLYDKTTNSGYNFTVGANALPQFNFFNGTSWTLLEVTSGYYMNIHNFASTSIDKKPFAVTGIAQYNTVALATAGQADELTSIMSSLPLGGFVLLSTVILSVKTSYTNLVNAAVVQNADGSDYTDWTKTALAYGAAPSNHDAMSGLKAAGLDVQWGHITNLAQTIYGIKTLNDLLIASQIAIGTTSAGTDKLRIFDTVHGTIAQYINYYGASVTAGGANYDIGLQSNMQANFDIAEGITDTGYRMGLDIAVSNNVATLLGTLTGAYGMRISYGNQNATATGAITNVYGIFLQGIKNGTVNITNFYSIYSDQAAAKMYHAGRVGIGVTDPTSILHIKDTVISPSVFFDSIKDATFSLSFGSTLGKGKGAGFIEFSDSANKLSLGAEAKEVITISTNRRVGIGETNPTAHLHIKADGSIGNAMLSLYNSENEKSFMFNTVSNGALLEMYQDNNGLRNVLGAGDNTYFTGRVAFGRSSVATVEKVEVSGYVLATGFKIPSGTASQYLKANGTVSTTAFAATLIELGQLTLVETADRFKVTADEDFDIDIPTNVNGRDIKIILIATDTLSVFLPSGSVTLGAFTNITTGVYEIDIICYGDGYLCKINKFN